MSGRSPRLISVTRIKLPQKYTKLSYIESNDGEYIDTGVSVDATNYNHPNPNIPAEAIQRTDLSRGDADV